jgi:inhibitor of KinA
MKIKIQEWEVFALGDHAFVFSLDAKMDPVIVQSITAFANFIKLKKVEGILDIIPSYHTLTIVYDIIIFSKNKLSISEHLISFCTQLLTEYSEQQKNDLLYQKSIIHVPVCYDIEFGIDLQNLSITKYLSKEEIISIHTSTIYEVYSIGFLPGFTYMGMVNEKIQMPRHEKPRMNVIAGSVGIAGLQTGIYPSNSPGGWQIIGRTPWNIFDANENVLAKFKVGDLVQFYAIEKNEFDKLNEHKN